eukprot:jgi/Mesvir1/16005/Mv08305-RA.1
MSEAQGKLKVKVARDAVLLAASHQLHRHAEEARSIARDGGRAALFTWLCDQMPPHIKAAFAEEIIQRSLDVRLTQIVNDELPALASLTEELDGLCKAEKRQRHKEKLREKPGTKMHAKANAKKVMEPLQLAVTTFLSSRPDEARQRSIAGGRSALVAWLAGNLPDDVKGSVPADAVTRFLHMPFAHLRNSALVGLDVLTSELDRHCKDHARHARVGEKAQTLKALRAQVALLLLAHEGEVRRVTTETGRPGLSSWLLDRLPDDLRERCHNEYFSNILTHNTCVAFLQLERAGGGPPVPDNRQAGPVDATEAGPVDTDTPAQGAPPLPGTARVPGQGPGEEQARDGDQGRSDEPGGAAGQRGTEAPQGADDPRPAAQGTSAAEDGSQIDSQRPVEDGGPPDNETPNGDEPRKEGHPANQGAVDSSRPVADKSDRPVAEGGAALLPPSGDGAACPVPAGDSAGASAGVPATAVSGTDAVASAGAARAAAAGAVTSISAGDRARLAELAADLDQRCVSFLKKARQAQRHKDREGGRAKRRKGGERDVGYSSPRCAGM